MARLTLSLLSSFKLTLDDVPVTAFDTAKVRALLAYLAVECDHAHRRESLAGLLWPDYPDRSARANLRNALARLRVAIGDRDLPSPCLLVEREWVQFNGAADAWVDVTAFARLAQADSSGPSGQPAAQQLEEAVALYQAPFLEGFSLPDSPPFEQWVLVTRVRLQRQMMDALARLAALQEQQGRYEQALATARRQLEIEPWHEGAHRVLMRLLAQRGERASALAQYEACVHALKEELDVEPSAETVTLYERIRHGVIRREAEAEPSPSVPSVHHNLPTQLTPFVGREGLLAEIGERLGDPGCRLLTLVGPGGSGKTRLALEAAARQMDSYPDGVFFVPLAPLHAVESIVPAIAQSLGFTFYSGGEPKQQLLDYLRRKRMLLVLDNYEHLLDGAGIATDILQAAPEVKVLATSRARLHVQGESRFLVEGMAVPTLIPGISPSLGRGELADAVQYSAIKLFLDSARRAQADFELTDEVLPDVIRICRLVEGMPLGILLAAAWVGLFTPAEIAVEIGRNLDFLESSERDTPERQRSLHAAFDHSWRLLGEREQEVFVALSVFRGGFTREAAEQVAGTPPRELAALADKSLLHRTAEGRYELHELLRQYGREKLNGSPDKGQGVHDRHSAHYCAALEGWGADLKGPRQRAALAEMDLEIDNVHTAWEWAVEQGHRGQVTQAAEGLHLFYDRRWRRQEGEATFRRAVERLEGVVAGQAPASAEAVQTLVQLLARQGRFLDDDTARKRVADRCQELLARPELAGRDVRRDRALVLRYLSRDLAGTDEARARSLYKQSLALCWELGDRWAQAELLGALAQLDYYAGDYLSATRLAEESLALFRALGDQLAVSHCLFFLNLLYLLLGQFEEAERAVQEQMAFAREWQDRVTLVQALDAQAGLLWNTARFGEAAEVHEKGYMALLEELGDRTRWANAKAWLGRFKLDSGDYAPVRALAEESLAIGRELNSQWVLCIGLSVLARLALLEERYSEARQFCQETLDAAKEFRAPMFIIWYKGELAVSRLRLGDAGQARHDLCDGLRVATSSSLGMDRAFLLPPAAELLAHEGQPERTVEVYALAMRYPLIANSRWYQDVFGKRMAAAATSLPPDVVAAAQQRGRALDLQGTLQELLTELEG